MKSIKVIKQLDAADCGAACLCMVASMYGRTYSLMQLKDLLYVGKCGVSLLSVARGAEAIGFKTIAVKASINLLDSFVATPCILHVNDTHYIVLYSVKRNKLTGQVKYHIVDPAYGKVVLSKEDLSQMWLRGRDQGVALLLQLNDYTSDEASNASKATSQWGILLRYFRPYTKYIPTITFNLLGGSCIAIELPFIMQAIVDMGVNGRSVSVVGIILIAQVIMSLAQMSMDYIRSLLLLHINVRIGIAIISDFLQKLMQIPIRFFDAKSQSDVLQRINDHSIIEDFLTDHLINGVFSMVTFVIFTCALGIYNMEYLAIFMSLTILSIAWTWSYNKKRRKLNFLKFQRNRDTKESVIEILNGMEEIKLNNNELQRRWAWENSQAKLFNLNLMDLHYQQTQKSGEFIMTLAKNAIITYLVANDVINGLISLGGMMSITYIIGVLGTPIEQVNYLVKNWQDAKLSMERLTELQHVDDEQIEGKKYLPIEDFSIHVDDLSFSYNGSVERAQLKHLNITVNTGETVAIVGPSGCGKTTLMKLLLGYYKPTQGKILIGDKDMNEVSLSQWRNYVGCVLQSGYIFSDTVKGNIIMGNEMNDDLLKKALEISNCEEFISALPFGIDTKIGMSGLNLSSGQKQRIMIARAIYKNPKVLMFDEATSALDSKNESDISSKLYDFVGGRTTVIIAHRLSTVKRADMIYVMNKGRIVERGRHEELLSQKGFYYELVQSQLVG